MKKLTIQQKADQRRIEKTKTPAASREGDRIDKVVAQINKDLGGSGRVYRGAEIQSRDYSRRSSGIPSLDYILNGGLPRGGLVELGGEYSSYKTTVSLKACAEVQRTTKGAVAFVALEPFSKRWAREVGFFIPFSEKEAADPQTGELKPIDPYAEASQLELLRMEQAGITDPYKEISPFVLVQEERGDVALDAALQALRSNEFEIIVVDSLGVARSTKWLEEKEVQDSGDFPREAKMLGDYTARAVLALNIRYDASGQPSKDGTYSNQTTLIHLNHIVTQIGTQAHLPWKQYSIKGGKGSEHNHHAIVFLWKGSQLRTEGKDSATGKPYVYGQEIRCIALKSKLGPPFMEGAFHFYSQPYGSFTTGDVDTVRDLVGLAEIASVIKRSGAWYEYYDLKRQGRDKLEEAFRDPTHVEYLERLKEDVRAALRR